MKFAAFSHPSAQWHAPARRARAEPLLFVGNVALNQTHHLASMNNHCFGAKSAVPDRAQEVDFELDRGERLALCEGATVCHAYCRVRYITKHSTMKRAHWIR